MSSGVWYRTLVYLGLREEPEEGYDDLPERSVAPASETRGREVRHERFDPVDDPDALTSDDASDDSNVRPLRAADAGHARSRGGSVRLAVVDITVFDDVEAVGSRYRTGQPVLFDVAGADGPTGRRVVDFVSGLTYASRGSMRKVGPRAFLLVPDGVALPDDEVDRLGSLGYRLGTGSGQG